MSKVLFETLPCGNVCWQGESATGIAALRFLARCTQLPQHCLPGFWDHDTPNSYCKITTWDGSLPDAQHTFVLMHHAMTARRDAAQPERISAALLDWETALIDPVKRALQVRQIYFLGLLPLLLRGSLFLVHGVCIRDSAGNGSLLCGPSGMGKSTVAAKLSRDSNEFEVLSDDFALISRDNHGKLWLHPAPTWSVWFAGKPAPISQFQCARQIPLHQLLFLERGSARCVPLREHESRLALTSASCSMLYFHLQNAAYPQSLQTELLHCAMTGAASIARQIPGFRLMQQLHSNPATLLQQLAGKSQRVPLSIPYFRSEAAAVPGWVSSVS